MTVLLAVSTASQSANSIRAIALYALVVLACAAGLLFKSQFAVYTLAALLPLQTTRYHLHAFPLGANIVDILLFCALAGSLLRPCPPLTRKSPIPVFLLCMAGFYYLSLWRGAFFLGTSLPLWFNNPRLVDYKNCMVMPLLVYAVVRTIRTRRQLALLIALCSLTSLAVDISYLKSSAGRSFTHYSEESRDAGPLGYAGENGLASYLVEVTCFLLPFLAIRPRRRFALLLLPLLAANICCILFSYSREAYLALIAGLFFVAIMRLRWLLIPLLCVGFAWQAILPVAVQERMAMTYSHDDQSTPGKLDASAAERVMIWTDALTLFHQNPVIGTGFLTYAAMKRVGPYRDTHNFYLKILVETGVVGLLLFLTQLFLFFREGFSLFRSTTDPFLSNLGLGFAALILSASIVNLFGDRWLFIQVDSNLWLLLGCVLSAASLAQSSTVPAPLQPRARPVRLCTGDAFQPALPHL